MNADALKLKTPPEPPPLPTMGDKLSRAIEGVLPDLDATDMAHLRVALVELIRLEKKAAWEAGAEHIDRRWHKESFGGTYWGHVPSRENPYRSAIDDQPA